MTAPLPSSPSWAGSRRLHTVTLAQRPDLAASIPAVQASRSPAFMLAGQGGHGVDVAELLAAVPQHQVLLLDPDDTILAVALSVPLRWDRTVDGLPAGWDGAVTAAADLAGGGGPPDTVCALSVTMTPAATGRGLAAGMVDALKAAAAGAGIDAMIAPVRPVLKAHYPLIPMSQYLAWRTGDGRPFDPWVRLHLRLGGVQVGVAYPSITIRGTVAQWQEWTDMALPGGGEFVVPGALVPLVVDRRTEQGSYREPHVWFVHRTA